MGAVYRRKRRSCGLCKPNKTGGAPARTARERAAAEAARRDIEAVLRCPTCGSLSGAAGPRPSIACPTCGGSKP